MPQLYYITDRAQFPGDERSRRSALLNKIREAAQASIDYIQLREKDLSGAELESLAHAAVAIVLAARATGSATRLLINSRVDVAIATQADGVHLPAQGLSVHQARGVMRVAGPNQFLVGISCHTVEEVAFAATSHSEASLVVFGPVFGKPSAPTVAATGLAALTQSVKAAAGVPLFAIGGVTLSNAHLCLEAGASGVAGIRLFQDNAIADVIRATRRS